MTSPSLKEVCSSLTLGGLESHHISQDEQSFIQSYKPSGVTLFARNIPNPKSISALDIIQELKQLNKSKKLPLIVAVDQEGGTVARLKHPKADPGPSLTLVDGKSDTKALESITNQAFDLGQSLKNCGFNVDFAPSVDITNSPDSKKCAINTRSFAMNHQDVIKRAGAFLKGLQKSKIYGCLKHFPGLGGIQIDTHKGTAVANYSLEELESKHLKPFAALMEQALLVLVSHAVYPSLDDKEATRSPKIMTELLRKKMGFNGIIVSDDLQMHAVSHSNLSWEEYILESISAGCDLLLICQGLEQWKKACDVILLEAQNSPLFKKRVFDSYQRIQSFRQKLSSC